MEANTLIKNFGGISKTAEFFGIAAPSVHEWKTKNRIPPLRIFQLRERRPDLFKDATQDDSADKADNGADTVSDQPITIVASPVTTESRDTNQAADFSTPPSAGAY